MKVWAYVVLVTALIAFVGSVYGMGHSKGYEKRDNEVQLQIIKAQEDARLEEAAKWEIVVANTKGSVETVEVIVEKVRVVEKRIPEVVETIVTLTPECADLGDGYARLRNDQIRAANSVRDTEVGQPVN